MMAPEYEWQDGYLRANGDQLANLLSTRARRSQLLGYLALSSELLQSVFN